MADQTRKQIHNDKANEALSQTVQAVTNRRWMAIRAAMGLPIAEIQSEQELLLIVAANERHRAEHGNDSWDKFLEMTEVQTLDYLGFDVSDDDTEDATKSVPSAA